VENPRELEQWGELSPKELLEGILLGVYELNVTAARQLELSEQIGKQAASDQAEEITDLGKLLSEVEPQPPTTEPGQAVRATFSIQGEKTP
jgi:hypothetical protein